MTPIFFKEAAHSLTQLFFPRHCVVCNRLLYGTEHLFCLSCRRRLPLTFSWERSFNPTLEKFTGRLPLHMAHSLLYFTHHGMTQKLIHQIKYRQRRDLAIELGRMLGRYICDSNAPTAVDYLVPVPLHRNKERQRGYNQAAEIALGMSEVMDIPLLKGKLIKIKNTGSQTHLSTFERIENVRDAYRVQQPRLLRNRRLLLVDDVLTTGATLEACARTLLKVSGVRISIATLAVATD